jgi:hypothetical protein
LRRWPYAFNSLRRGRLVEWLIGDLIDVRPNDRTSHRAGVFHCVHIENTWSSRGPGLHAKPGSLTFAMIADVMSE